MYQNLVLEQEPRARDPHDTTKWYSAKFIDMHPSEWIRPKTVTYEAVGRVGFITSMSSHFCGGCNRLRITADGQLKTCLFSSGDGLSLRDLLRRHTDVKDIIPEIERAVKAKKAVLGGHQDAQDIAEHSKENRPMILIGG